MPQSQPKVTAYIKARAPFARPLLTHMRRVIRAAGPELTETLKWGMPSYTHRGNIVCGFAGFTAHCTLWFFGARKRVVAAPKRDAMGQFGRIASRADLPSEAMLTRYIKRAIASIDAAGAATASRAAGKSAPRTISARKTPTRNVASRKAAVRRS
jgi:hypothetical protein